MRDFEIEQDEREGLQALMASEEYNTNLVADNPPPRAKDAPDAWGFVVNGAPRIRDYATGERVYVKTADGGYTAKFDHYTEFPGKVYVIADLLKRAKLVNVEHLSKVGLQ